MNASKADDLIADQHRYAPGIGVLIEFRQTEFRVLIDEVERIFVRRGLQRQHDVIPRRSHVAADDHRLRIEDVDQEGDGLADLFAGLLDQLDREIVVILRCGDDVVDMNGLFAVVFLPQDRIDPFGDQCADLLLDGDTRNFGLQTPLFPAGADLLVVEEGDMAEFAGESALSVVELSLHDDADGDAPAQMQIEHVVFILGLAAGIFRIASGTGVVFEERADADPFLDDFTHRLFVRGEIFVAASRIRIYASGNTYTDP